MKSRNILIMLREEKELKQDELATILRTTQQNISLIENGKRNPSIVLAKRYEVFFNREMEELFPDIFLELETTSCNKN